MQFDISYNPVRVSDPIKAHGICIRYAFQGAKFMPDEQQLLQYIVPNQNLEDDDRWPKALLVEDMPNKGDFNNEDAYWDAVFQAFLGKGNKGFESFLREMGPLLEEPLFILAVGKGGLGSNGTAWYVDSTGRVEVRSAHYDDSPGEEHGE